jgi:hypothetical protein
LGDGFVVLGVTLDDVDDGTEETDECLLAQGGDLQATFGADGGFTGLVSEKCEFWVMFRF